MKKTIGIILLFTTIVVGLIVSMAIAIGPKEMKSLISFENVEKIEMLKEDSGDYEELTNEEIGVLLNRVSRTKCKRRYLIIKQGNSRNYLITYKDGSTLRFGDVNLVKRYPNGRVKSAIQYRIYWDGKLADYNNWPE